MTNYNSDTSMTLEYEIPLLKNPPRVSAGSMWYRKENGKWTALIMILVKGNRWLAMGTTHSALYIKIKGKAEELTRWEEITEESHKKIAHILYGVRLAHQNEIKYETI